MRAFLALFAEFVVLIFFLIFVHQKTENIDFPQFDRGPFGGARGVVLEPLGCFPGPGRARNPIFRFFLQNFRSFCQFLRFAVRSNFFSKNRSRRCDFFGPTIVKMRAILTIFPSFEVFARVRYLFGCFELDPGRKELEIYSVRDLYDSTIRCRGGVDEPPSSI